MKLFKLANRLAFKYALGASKVFNILGLTPSLKEIENLLEKEAKKKYIHIDPWELGNLAQKRFNQMVAPYLNMKPVDISMVYDFDLFLHDLIHEALKEGSTESFIEKDKLPPSPTKYSLEEFLEEDVAQFLSTIDNTSGGLEVYVENLEERVTDPKSPQDLADQINQIMTPEIESISKESYKHFLNRFKRSFIFEVLNSKEVEDFFAKDDLSGLFRYLSVYSNNYVNERAKNLSLIDNERKASLLRRWLMQVKKDIINLIDSKEQQQIEALNNYYDEQE